MTVSKNINFLFVTASGFEEQRENKFEIEEYEDDSNVIDFEDELHNTIYVRYVLKKCFAFANFIWCLFLFPLPRQMRERREISPKTITQSLCKRISTFPVVFGKKSFDLNASMDDRESTMDPTNTHYTYLYKEVNASVSTLTLNDLKHFAHYSISVKACREGDGDNCGMLLMI